MLSTCSLLLGGCGGSGLDPVLSTTELRQVAMGPWLHTWTPDRVTLRWMTETDCQGAVFYEAHGDARIALEPEAGRLHRLELQGLAPATSYRYRIACGDEGHEAAFSTGPAPEAPFRVAIWGDNQTFADVGAQVAQAIADSDPALVLSVGDIVDDGEPFAPWPEQFFGPISVFADRLPIAVAPGNHDGESDWAKRLIDLPGGLRYGAFTYGGVRFVLLNSNLPLEPGSAQLAWLDLELASPAFRSARWQVVLAHKPYWCEGWDGGTYDGEAWLRDVLPPRFAAAGVDLVLHGHAHGYERGALDGVTYLITGGGGGKLDFFLHDFPHIERSIFRHHFLTLDVSADRLLVVARGHPDGEPFDSVEIGRTPPQPTVPGFQFAPR